MTLLPVELLRKRITNELALCRERLPHRFRYSDFQSFPADVEVKLRDVRGYELLDNGTMQPRSEHEFRMTLPEGYPYHKPIVRWQSEIYHPNIMPLEEGGYVCTRLLSDWGFTSTLYDFMRGLERLVQCPDCDSPFGQEMCQRAARDLREGMEKGTQNRYDNRKREIE